RDLLASDPSEMDDTIFALAATAAIPMPDSPLDDAPPRAVADALAQAWPRFATVAASSGPLIMVVEDRHWAGEPLLDMLVRLVSRSSDEGERCVRIRPRGGYVVGYHEDSVADRRAAS